MKYVLGVDLGAEQDPTALALIEHRPQAVPDPMNPGSLMIKKHYHLRSLYRFRLGTPYSSIVDSIKRRLQHPDLHGDVQLCVDRTGVGAGVVEMMSIAGLAPMSIYITAGQITTSSRLGLNVPKMDLIASLTVLMQSNRLHAAPGLDFENELKEELQNFRLKKTRNGQDTASAWRQGDHDDLVLSLAIAAYVSMKLNEHALPNEKKLSDRKHDNVFAALGV